jgi:hypothetical protein
MFVGADAKNLYLGMWKEALCERFVRRWAFFETSNREMISSMGKRAEIGKGRDCARLSL